MSAPGPSRPVAIIGTDGTVERYSTRTTQDNYAASGLNLGNLAFQRAVFTHIADDKVVIPFNFVPAEVRERFRLVCMPSANYLYQGFDFADLAARLEATGLPLLIIGLGIQAKSSISEVVLQPGTARLLALFAERCETIFVRGAQTGAFLESQGVHNFEALGCPSNFLSPNPNLGRVIAHHTARLERVPPARVAFAPTFYRGNTDLELALLEEVGASLARIVCQEPVEAVALSRGSRNRALETWATQDSGFLAALPAERRAALLRLLVAYFSVEAWLEAYRRSDLVIGTRIHGISLGWQAGRPSLLVGHDLRTRELAQTMGLPLMSPAEATAGSAMPRMRARIAELAGSYDAHRAGLAARYVALLARHGVTASADLHGLAEHGARLDSPVRTQAEQIAALPAPASAPRDGFLERFSRAAISGWSRGATAEAAAVEIVLDGTLVQRVVPDAPRPDAGPDAWQFHLRTPEAYRTLASVQVEARLVASGTHLTNSPSVARFGAEQPEAVLQGRERVLFLSDASSNALAQARGEQPLDAAALARWRGFLQGFDDVVSAFGARGYLLIAPGKEVVLGRYLPEGQVVSEDRPARQIEVLAAGLARVRVVYPLAPLAAQPLGMSFTRGDTHWTGLAAGLALEQLWVQDLAPPGEVRFPAAGEAWESVYYQGDLLVLQGGSTMEARPICRRPRQYALLSTVPNTALGTRRRFASTDPRAEGTALLFHDWLGEQLIGALAEQFRTTTTAFAQSLDSELVEANMPDVVIYEVAERFLPTAPGVV